MLQKSPGTVISVSKCLDNVWTHVTMCICLCICEYEAYISCPKFKINFLIFISNVLERKLFVLMPWLQRMQHRAGYQMSLWERMCFSQFLAFLNKLVSNLDQMLVVFICNGCLVYWLKSSRVWGLQAEVHHGLKLSFASWINEKPGPIRPYSANNYLLTLTLDCCRTHCRAQPTC